MNKHEDKGMIFTFPGFPLMILLFSMKCKGYYPVGCVFPCLVIFMLIVNFFYLFDQFSFFCFLLMVELLQITDTIGQLLVFVFPCLVSRFSTYFCPSLSIQSVMFS